ncbi:MAG: flippase-like domain-containing protein [Nitrospirales bacterium]|nr:flippase-like domain-containing protein [Nitrospira sp.]MDR4501895.1 flippase-like domain-containing protein [Nitrospirales bacterium]
MYYLRLFVSLLVSVIVLMFIPWDDVKVFSRDHQLIASYLVLAGLLIYVDRVVNAIRWFILIDHRGTRLRFFQILGIYFKSTFLGLVAPSGAGGEFLKGYGLVKSGVRITESVSSLFVERILGLVALVGTCLCGFALFHQELELIPGQLITRIIFGGIGLGVIGVIVAYFCFPWFERRIPLESKVNKGLQEIRRALGFYQQIKARIIVALILSFMVQLVRIYFTWCIGLGVGMTSELPYYFLFVPVISLVSMIPISIAGLGVQEGAFVYFFSLIEANLVLILAMALLVRVYIVISVLPGAVLYARDGIGVNAQRIAKNHKGNA